jgi:hypothetical protein
MQCNICLHLSIIIYSLLGYDTALILSLQQENKMFSLIFISWCWLEELIKNTTSNKIIVVL